MEDESEAGGSVFASALGEGAARGFADARARWPTIALTEAELLAHLARLGRPAPVYAIDTCSAAACTMGDEAALRVFEEELVARVPSVVRRFDASPAFAAEICQLLRVRLLVRDGDAPPRMARYTGEVPLSAWIRVIALRLALNAKRGANSATSNDSASTLADPTLDDPEIDYLRTQYREPFARAFEHTLSALSKDDRTILRLHYVDGVNIDGIGRIFQVHRATIARWLVRIRTDLLALAKARLALEIGAELGEVESVVGALAAELD